MEIEGHLAQADHYRQRNGRPFCTLTYAQSIDGCIGFKSGSPMRLSGEESMVLTHWLRSRHDAILVGIRTVIADNPRLNVRMVEGASPQPVVLDSRLRIPLECHLLNNGYQKPWIAAGQNPDARRELELQSIGARVFRLPTDSRGRIELESLLGEMAQLGVNSLMVEGGGRVLTSFMKARLVDQVIITIAPVVVGGLRAFLRLGERPELLPALENVTYTPFGRDMVVCGRPLWNRL
jgi:3,4-dihydroxy 2-butanone 4-phosphate synthase/GTP cyclohydrolase II